MDTNPLFESCFIDSGYLSDRPTPVRTRCEASSRRAVRDFTSARFTAQEHRFLDEHEIIERALVTATALLGGEGETPAHIGHKRRLHLLLTVNMTWQWILDEVVDARRGRDCEAIFAFLQQRLIPAAQDPETIERTRPAANEAANEDPSCARLGRMVLPLVRWLHELGRDAGIDMSPGSLFVRFNREFLESLPHLWDEFDSWADYEQHRARNCALNQLVLCQVSWLCHLRGVDPRACMQALPGLQPLFYRYGVLGGVANDLFGYDKDLLEGMATSVEVFKRLDPSAGPACEWDECSATSRAFAAVIRIHNTRLTELREITRFCRDPHEAILLDALLATTHCIRDLHLLAISVYGGGTLRSMLDVECLARAS